MRGSYIDRLYVDPAEGRKGWGTRLVDFAKSVSPGGLELCTHQQNHGARALYERHGFTAVRFGTSPAPENAPDVEYHWRPD
jgi:ribosomal protein S18 acetylase RimI-like enzyme